MAIKVAQGILSMGMQQLADEPLDIDLPELPDEPTEIPPINHVSVKSGAKKGTKKPTLLKIGDMAEKLHLAKGFCLITELHVNMSKRDKDRPYHRLHASDVTRPSPEFCPRERALLIASEAEPNEKYISTETRTYFDVGECYHDLVREKWGLPISYGYWLCQGCETRLGVSGKPTKCTKCGSKNFKYDEQRVESLETMISCGIDWQVKKDALPYAVAVEIKSIKADEFKKLLAPHSEHRIRTALYLHSLDTAKNPSKVAHIRKDYAYILYVSKGAPDEGSYLGGGGFVEKRTPFKMFQIDRDDELIEPYLEKGRQFKRFKETHKLPDRICSKSTSTRAKKCSMCSKCWG
ncbi:rubredoxin-type fold protein [Vibrio phage LV6]|nr:rubredoxin-type fold protein [Vibrio phage LV6]